MSTNLILLAIPLSHYLGILDPTHSRSLLLVFIIQIFFQAPVVRPLKMMIPWYMYVLEKLSRDKSARYIWTHTVTRNPNNKIEI